MRVRRIDRRPLDGKEFAALMAPFEPFEASPALAVAVSGGRDSLSLAILARDWAVARDGTIIALIVDHGLRDVSAAEAAATRFLMTSAGFASEVLVWTGDKPRRGIQEAARAARYDLLLEACRRHGVLHLLVGHHAGDQAETVTMRARRGSGIDGLAGMAGLAERRHARLLRPLLSVARRRLTATLRARGMAWVDDPSNADPRFERARLRAAGALDAAGDHHSAAACRAAAERRLGEAAVSVMDVDPDNGLALDCGALAGLPEPIAARLLSRVVQRVGGGGHPPRRDRLARALARLVAGSPRGAAGKSQDFTLSGCRLMLRPTNPGGRLRWIVQPESGRNGRRNDGQPLVPAAFFACDRPDPTHLD